MDANKMEYPLKEKVVVITGASSGIGKATAEALAQQGALVAMVCRDQVKAQAAIDEILKKVPHANLKLHLADLSSMQQVRTLAEELQKAYPAIDVLLNNAGLISGIHELTPEGWEVSWAINHMAPFLLTNLLLDSLLSAQQARVINVSSEAHRLGEIDFEQFLKQANYSAITAYADTKLANILFTYELARRTEFTSITANTLHPGVVATSFGKNSNFFIKSIFTLGRVFMKSPVQGAQTSIYLASAPELKEISGKYFKNKKPVKSSASSYNTHIARRLWELSAEQVGL